MDRYFNRGLDEAERKLGEAIKSATIATEIDRLLADETFRGAHALASAAAFRKRQGAYVRDGNGKGWNDSPTRTLKPDPAAARPSGERQAVRHSG